MHYRRYFSSRRDCLYFNQRQHQSPWYCSQRRLGSAISVLNSQFDLYMFLVFSVLCRTMHETLRFSIVHSVILMFSFCILLWRLQITQKLLWIFVISLHRRSRNGNMFKFSTFLAICNSFVDHILELRGFPDPKCEYLRVIYICSYL